MGKGRKPTNETLAHIRDLVAEEGVMTQLRHGGISESEGSSNCAASRSNSTSAGTCSDGDGHCARAGDDPREAVDASRRPGREYTG